MTIVVIQPLYSTAANNLPSLITIFLCLGTLEPNYWQLFILVDLTDRWFRSITLIGSWAPFNVNTLHKMADTVFDEDIYQRKQMPLLKECDERLPHPCDIICLARCSLISCCQSSALETYLLHPQLLSR